MGFQRNDVQLSGKSEMTRQTNRCEVSVFCADISFNGAADEAEVPGCTDGAAATACRGERSDFSTTMSRLGPAAESTATLVMTHLLVLSIRQT